MKTPLLMLVEQDAEGRITGVIFQEGQFRPGCFSGTPEMLKILEEVLPLERPLLESAGGIGPPQSPSEPAGER